MDNNQNLDKEITKMEQDIAKSKFENEEREKQVLAERDILILEKDVN